MRGIDVTVSNGLTPSNWVLMSTRPDVKSQQKSIAVTERQPFSAKPHGFQSSINGLTRV